MGTKVSDLTEATELDANDLLFAVVDGNGRKVSYLNTIGNKLIVIQDQKTQGAGGGTFTSGDWRTRDLNTELVDQPSAASLDSNQITLAAGTYIVRATAPATYVGKHQARLYNATSTQVLQNIDGNDLIGTSEKSNHSWASTTKSAIGGIFTLTTETVIELQHQCETTQAGSGFGAPGNFATEVYSTVHLWKVV